MTTSYFWSIVFNFLKFLQTYSSLQQSSNSEKAMLRVHNVVTAANLASVSKWKDCQNVDRRLKKKKWRQYNKEQFHDMSSIFTAGYSWTKSIHNRGEFTPRNIN